MRILINFDWSDASLAVAVRVECGCTHSWGTQCKRMERMRDYNRQAIFRRVEEDGISQCLGNFANVL